jgi:endonuclease YncB( thermonuclease family)
MELLVILMLVFGIWLSFRVKPSRFKIRYEGFDRRGIRYAVREWESAKGLNYHCGATAARVLEEFLSASRPTRCKFVERDRYGRFVGDCYRADGASVAELLVLSGWALDWPRYSKGEYADEQAQARVMRLGLWAGKFTSPWEWRAQRRSKRADGHLSSIDSPRPLGDSPAAFLP